MVSFLISNLEALYFGINVQLLPIATAIGTPLQGLKILISLLFLYPLSIGFKRLQGFQPNLNETIRHGYMGATGLILGWFCIGMDMKYCLFSSFITFGLLNFAALIHSRMGNHLIGFYITIANFIFNFLYLLILYAWFETSEYDMDVTLVQSLLCLRNISIMIDFYDIDFGYENSDPSHGKVLSSQLEIKGLPTLNVFLGYSYCFTSFLTGPSIQYSSYCSIVSDTSDDKNYSLKAAKTFLLGMGYLISYQVLVIIFPCSYIFSKEYSSMAIFYKLLYLIIAGKVAMMKYFGVWLLGEGATYLGGGSFCYKTQDNEPVSKFMNIRPHIFETSFRFRSIIDSFNIKTNAFGKLYIFKRCAIFRKKWLSTALTVSFLCVWHGFHYGYYHCFLAEYTLLLIDDNIRNIPTSLKIGRLMSSTPKIVKVFALHSILYMFFVSFEMMSFSSTLVLLKSVYFIPVFALFFSLPLSYVLLVIGQKAAKQHHSS